MPPYVPRKRASPPPDHDPPPTKRVSTKRSKAQPNSRSNAAKSKPSGPPTGRTPQSSSRVNNAEAILQKMQENDADSGLSDTGSSSTTSESKNHGKGARSKPGSSSGSDEDNDDTASDSSSDAGVDWAAELEKDSQDPGKGDSASKDLVLTLDQIQDVDTSYSKRKEGKKYAPTKREKAARNAAHCLHVQTLMVHNLMRNHWCDDKEVQRILVDGLSEGCKKEVARWRKACGNTLKPNAGLQNDTSGDTPKGSNKPKGKNKVAVKNRRDQRDWGGFANELEVGVPNMSHGDPSLRLLKILSAYWKKRFNVTAPGLRKMGYKDNKRITKERKAWAAGNFDVNIHGERVESKAHFRALAKRYQGSRDVGSQLFTALLRAVGMETRLIASLQPLGFGWSKNEEADPPKRDIKDFELSPKKNGGPLNVQPESLRSPIEKQKSSSNPLPPVRPPRSPQNKKQSSGNTKADAIKLETSDSDLSSPPPSDDESIIELNIATPSTKSKKFDRDLPYPIYWTEVISPITNQVIALDPMVLNVIANNQDSFVVFEPRGAKADRAKQVMAYVVAFSSDNSAKDVTVRYLKKRVWPGKTKGVRMPLEKVPIYNRNGKIRRYEERDFFKRIMSLYGRPSAKHTSADNLEDERDLVPVLPNKDIRDGAENETLAWYKTSAEFVLERHLRREEALLSTATPVKQFQPLKQVPMRAVTTIRKRQIEAAEAQMGGEKMMQGLYAKHQTDWIIPPAIENGVIPKNAYGNMDVYVPTMVPKGAIHIPLRGTAKVCRKLGIDHAEAVTGFEFGNRMAVPILTGVVVAKENEDSVIDAWEADQVQQRQREALKKEKANLGMWKRFMTGLRVLERMREQYGDDSKLGNDKIQEALRDATAKPVRAKKKTSSQGRKATTTEVVSLDTDEETMPTLNRPHDVLQAGGFLREEESEAENAFDAEGEGFIVEGEDDDIDATVTPTRDESMWKGTRPRASNASSRGDSRGNNRGGRARGRSGAAHGNLSNRNQEISKHSRKVYNTTAKDDKATQVTRVSTERTGRKAARKSADAVRSHYFADSDEDRVQAGSEDMTEGSEEEQPPKKKIAREKGLAQGHGRGDRRGGRHT
ncbi:hypothetical protein FH972_023710 [Carpinus fangiana]|uniref:Rad4 beta-hairpin domain-containing protein n=1 Tax=Carpinus fangiana TaxID=176857 RepID=A0A5N6KVZ5_9ROSI|nr:hypothetical protein FH972_023710 [Carpinus fangiana]